MPYKPVRAEIKQEIINSIKIGSSVKEVSEKYGVGIKTIYRWLNKGASKSSETLEMSRLKRENEALKSILGVCWSHHFLIKNHKPLLFLHCNRQP